MALEFFYFSTSTSTTLVQGITIFNLDFHGSQVYTHIHSYSLWYSLYNATSIIFSKHKSDDVASYSKLCKGITLLLERKQIP